MSDRDNEPMDLADALRDPAAFVAGMTETVAVHRAGGRHTPGPWLAHLTDSRPSPPRLIIGQKSRTLAHVPRGANPKEAAEFDANARLMAAAPELLAVLEAAAPLVGLLGAKLDWPTEVKATAAAIQAAIRKATHGD